MPQVVLYTRQGCHLCDDAHEMLKRHGLLPKLIDIDADPLLRERYNECVPVVTIDGKERFRGRINEILLSRLLRPSRHA
jgi:glutaredoxin